VARGTFEVRAVLVRPLHDLNVGSVCRVIKNFGVKDLAIVKPKCPLGFEAKKFAKHSEEVLSKAKICETLEEAVEGCDVVVGTTGAPKRFRKTEFKNCIPLGELKERLASSRNAAIVFGSEGSGLSKEECGECDFFATISASDEHQVLNLSHAVAVVFYELFKGKKSLYARAKRRDVKQIEEFFALAVEERARIKDKRKVVRAFERALGRAGLSDNEARTLLVAFSELNAKD